MNYTLNEAFYQDILEKYLKSSHCTLDCGITDITTNTCHAEIKNWKNWKTAVGQLLIYNASSKKDRLEVYFFGDTPLKEQKEMIIKYVKGLNIYAFEFIHKDNIVEILDSDNNCVHSVTLTESITNTPFKCKRCGKEFSSKQLVLSHLQRKKACAPLLSNTPQSVLENEIRLHSVNKGISKKTALEKRVKLLEEYLFSNTK